jgi:creatinine amidohydrolase/Fe(II)-dependent formamide hydrolase-like protein
MHELESLTAPRLRDLIERGVTTAVVPFGSIEQQGGHLPLGSDALLADYVGREVAARLDAVLAPTVRVGCAPRHTRVAGTLTLAPATLTDVAVEIGESLAKHGFRVIAMVSTHGGNAAPLAAAAQRLNEALPSTVVCAPVGDLGPRPGRHSGEWLSSVMLTLHPELVELGVADRSALDELRDASPDRGRDHLARFVAAIVEGVRAVTG